MRAAVVDPAAPGRVSIQQVEDPQPTAGEALVRVAAFSLNRGEVRDAQRAAAGRRIGWDVAGTVVRATADGSSPKAGARVVGLVPTGAWAELVAVPAASLATLPDAIAFTQAAALPIAGLTALHALEYGGLLLGRTVLVTGASGGVGLFAVQLARAAGARVVGAVGRPESAGAARAAGAHEVVSGGDLAPAAKFGPYHLILESVGGPTLASALGLLEPGGVCVSFGVAEQASVAFDARRFYGTCGTLRGFLIFEEIKRESAGRGLARLVRLMAEGRLRPPVEVQAPWTEVGNVAQRLLERRFTGKAVLTVGE